jgi:hypothetical protein
MILSAEVPTLTSAQQQQQALAICIFGFVSPLMFLTSPQIPSAFRP